VTRPNGPSSTTGAQTEAFGRFLFTQSRKVANRKGFSVWPAPMVFQAQRPRPETAVYRRWDGFRVSARRKWRRDAKMQPAGGGTASDLQGCGHRCSGSEDDVRTRAPGIQLLLLLVVILLLILVHAVPASPGRAWTTAGLRSGTGGPDAATSTVSVKEMDGLGRRR
jgi:hypothetical protein